VSSWTHGDDKGPGNYVYPPMACIRPFLHLVEFEVTGGDSPDFKATVNDKLADPGHGRRFATQMISSSSIRTVRPAAVTPRPARLNIQFAPESAWKRL